MRNVEWVGALVLGGVVLGAAAYGYAQLGRTGCLILEVMAESMWRLMSEHVAASLGGVSWVALAALLVTGLLVGVVALRKDQTAAPARGASHE